MKVFSFERMWYSSAAYQMSPNLKLPAPHFCSEKSSENDEGKTSEFEFVFALTLGLAFAFVEPLVLRLATTFVFESFVLPPMFDNAISTTTKPIPITAKTARPPNTHQTAFDFLCGAARGVGVHDGGGGGGGEGDGATGISGR